MPLAGEFGVQLVDEHAEAAIAVAPAGTRAYTLDGTGVAPGCAVPGGDKLVPAWVA